MDNTPGQEIINAVSYALVSARRCKDASFRIPVICSAEIDALTGYAEACVMTAKAAQKMLAANEALNEHRAVSFSALDFVQTAKDAAESANGCLESIEEVKAWGFSQIALDN